MKRLKSAIVPIGDVSEKQKREMFDLYFRYFENVTLDIFLEHISHKGHVIILTDNQSDAIKGFCTCMVIELQVSGENIVGIFTGDTIIERSHWGEQELVRAFTYYCGQIAAHHRRDKIYWLLISKGYKTYRFLPVFTKEFYPAHDQVFPPSLKKIRNALATHLYPDEFDAKTDLITFKNKIGNLRSGIGDIDDLRLQDPAIEFFAKANPEHMQGVELACIAELSSGNLKSIAKTYFEKGLASGKGHGEI
ncbi:MAG: hypothetical protein A2X86_11475 [Bdellovibrionales bacterium GWA2_49_15]|nr:MAG: hypothetical protein A2X86_11475 [Bdellovibrionales bacterium GWA2_49_15]HAZ12629.1 hypothetical protein [Bdellovibrionales bacterium]